MTISTIRNRIDEINNRINERAKSIYRNGFRDYCLEF